MIVDTTEVARDFGTTPEALRQPFRHIVGIIPIHGRQEFLKLSTAEGTISKYTENEAEILRRIGNRQYSLPVFTPTVRREGIYRYNGHQLTWFTTDYIKSQELYPFTPENPANPDSFEQHLPTIVDTTIAIMDWPQDRPLPIDIPKNRVASDIQHKVNEWMNERLSTPEMIKKAARAFELQEQFFTNENQPASVLDTGPSHGDFVPNNFRIAPDGDLYLMDLEHAKMNWLKFYDVAYMYHRLYTKYKNPELARVFLKSFIEKYAQNHSFDEREIRNFKTALAQRLIGGYFDAAADEVTSWQLQDELAMKLLSVGSLESFL